MEVRVTPELEKRPVEFAAQRGRSPGEVVEDALSGYFEKAGIEDLLDRRDDELASGRVQPIDGEEAYRSLMEKTAAQRSGRA